MPPQIKQDLNRSGWETTDFPSVCENCLPENPYVQMLKEDYGAECKIVSFFSFLFFFSLPSQQAAINTRCISARARLRYFAGKPIAQRGRREQTSV